MKQSSDFRLLSCPYCFFKYDIEGVKNSFRLEDMKFRPADFITNLMQENMPYFESAHPAHKELSSKKYQENMQGLDYLYSDFMMPFEVDINLFLKNRFKSLNKGGVLCLTTPTSGYFFKSPLIQGQMNIFLPKNVMFLLEKHGFRLVDRSPKWQNILQITAQKM